MATAIPAATTADTLRAGAVGLGVPLDDQQLAQLLAYAALLTRWNQAHNLVSRQDLHRLFDRHLLDCLSLVPLLAGDTLLDVGTGGGLPGVVLAIVRPDMQCTLLDSNGRKTRFLLQAKAELALANVTVVQARSESWQAPAPFATIVSRAVADRALLVRLAGQHGNSNSLMLRMAGPADEVAAVAATPDTPALVDGTGAEWQLLGQQPVHLPGVDQTLYIDQLRRAQ